jgi:hydroxymethylglutaryl-CoA lyase
MEIGAHLHSNPTTAIEKIEAALTSGCRRFDGAINGFGGCPMAEDKLVGNLATETIVAHLTERGMPPSLNMEAFREAVRMAGGFFNRH